MLSSNVTLTRDFDTFAYSFFCRSLFSVFVFNFVVCGELRVNRLRISRLVAYLKRSSRNRNYQFTFRPHNMNIGWLFEVEFSLSNP